MRTTFDLSLLLACGFASLAIWRSPPRLPSALDSVAATRITGRQTPPPVQHVLQYNAMRGR